MYWFMPLYTLLCFSTVYIKAHYAVDAMAGIPFGIVFYFILAAIYDRIKG
jgi:membrane-associated phospholipid phosphatase